MGVPPRTMPRTICPPRAKLSDTTQPVCWRWYPKAAQHAATALASSERPAVCAHACNCSRAHFDFSCTQPLPHAEVAECLWLQARQAALDKVMLTCFTANASAHAFYTALGYTRDASSPDPSTAEPGLQGCAVQFCCATCDTRHGAQLAVVCSTTGPRRWPTSLHHVLESNTRMVVDIAIAVNVAMAANFAMAVNIAMEVCCRYSILSKAI